MRLYLAVAVLVLALVAFTEAQSDTLEQRFSQFGEHVSELGRNVADKAKDAFQTIRDSEFGETTRNWFEQLKNKFQELGQ